MSRKLELKSFFNADKYGDKVDRKSTNDNLFKFQGLPISWFYKKQSVITLLSCEVEYVEVYFETF